MKKILIVDDQSEVREFLSDFLTLKGFDVVLASNGKEALEVLDEEHPDAAVVDVEMPVMNGMQFSRKVLAQKSGFPILIITAFLKKYSENDFLDLGVRSVLQKPIDLNILQTEIQSAVP